MHSPRFRNWAPDRSAGRRGGRAAADPASGLPERAFVDIRPRIARDAETRTIGVTYEIAEGPRVYVDRINIAGNGPHSRRTRLLYEKALGPGFQIGIFNVEERGFDPKGWWKTSQGFRTVVDETIAYAYARFFFSPPKPQP